MELERVLEILNEEGVFMSDVLLHKLKDHDKACDLQAMADADYSDYLDSLEDDE